ncbi:Os08g0354900, partial [Oryza sativa Japonica Group]
TRNDASGRWRHDGGADSQPLGTRTGASGGQNAKESLKYVHPPDSGEPVWRLVRQQYDVTGKAPASGEHGEEEQRQRCHHPASVAKRTQGSNEAACMTIAPTPSLRPHGVAHCNSRV